jgi:UDP-N-acetyl-D-glucosamine dehydrogenase
MVSVLPTDTQQLNQKIKARTAQVGIIGMGYVGLPLTLLFVEQGFPVTGLDIDDRKVKKLNIGESYIARIPSSEIEQARDRGFSATSDYSKISDLDAVIICVPTPLDDFHQPDLSCINETARAIAPYLRAGQLVVLESTTYPGTTEEVLIPLLEAGNRSGLKVERAQGGEDSAIFYVAFSPEREDPGNITVARRDIPKVIGGVGPASSELAAALYGSIFWCPFPHRLPRR